MHRSLSNRIGIIGDRILFAALCVYALAACAIGWQYGQGLTGLLGAGLALAVGGAALLAHGTLVSRMVLALALSALVALHIHMGRGTLEFHFGVFVTLALLLVYRDWRPIVAVAGFFAVHHVLFDRLQAAGFAIYCTPEADFMKILMHAGYVVVQAGLEVFMAVSLTAVVRQSDELQALLAAISANGQIALDVRYVPVQTRGGKALKDVLEKMHDTVAQVRGSSEMIQMSGGEIAQGNQDLSGRTEQSAASLQQTARSVEQLAQTSRESAASAQSAGQLAENAAQVARRGGEVVASVVTTMGEINSTSQRMSDILGVIDGIAFQTNILALNAAVEAARAGSQGRGFAVVATEVRSLAQRSASAAREIKGLIEASGEKVRSGTELVNQAGATMKDILSSVEQFNQAMAGIRHAADVQSQGMSEINLAVAHLDNVTQQNAALVEQSAAAAETLRNESANLTQKVSVFKLALGAQPALA